MADWIHEKQNRGQNAVVDHIFTPFDEEADVDVSDMEPRNHTLGTRELLCRRTLDVLPLTFRDLETIRKFEVISMPWLRKNLKVKWSNCEFDPDSDIFLRMTVSIYEIYPGLFRRDAVGVLDTQIAGFISSSLLGSSNSLSLDARTACPAKLRKGFLKIFLDESMPDIFFSFVTVRLKLGMPFVSEYSSSSIALARADS